MKLNYTELEVWKSSRALVKQVYLLCTSFPNEELYALTNQVRRCSVSVPSNIAEGLGRQSIKETIHFLCISKGSIYELETQLFLAFDLDYISKEKLNVSAYLDKPLTIENLLETVKQVLITND